MKLTVLKRESFKVSRWSGGVTTEIFIYPEGSDYASREFMARVSSASVELAESDFTPLPGVTRYITPLSGGFTLTHPGKEPVVMAPLDRPYRFDGGEATHSEGVAADFNLMLKDARGRMEVCRGEAPAEAGINVYYPVKGAVSVNGETVPINEGDALLIELREGESALVACEACIFCHIDV